MAKEYSKLIKVNTGTDNLVFADLGFIHRYGSEDTAIGANLFEHQIKFTATGCTASFNAYSVSKNSADSGSTQSAKALNLWVLIANRYGTMGIPANGILKYNNTNYTITGIRVYSTATSITQTDGKFYFYFKLSSGAELSIERANLPAFSDTCTTTALQNNTTVTTPITGTTVLAPKQICFGNNQVENGIKHVKLPFESTIPTPGPYRFVTGGQVLAGITSLSNILGTTREVNGDNDLLELLMSTNGDGGGWFLNNSASMGGDTQKDLRCWSTLAHGDGTHWTCGIYIYTGPWQSMTGSNLITAHNFEITRPNNNEIVYADVCFCKKRGGALAIQYTARVDGQYTYDYFEYIVTAQNLLDCNPLAVMMRGQGQTLLAKKNKAYYELDDKLYAQGGPTSGSGWNTQWAGYWDYNLKTNGPSTFSTPTWRTVISSTQSGTSPLSISDGLVDHTSSVRVTGKFGLTGAEHSFSAAIDLNGNYSWQSGDSGSAGYHIIDYLNISYDGNITISGRRHTWGQHGGSDPGRDVWSNLQITVTKVEQFYADSGVSDKVNIILTCTSPNLSSFNTFLYICKNGYWVNYNTSKNNLIATYILNSNLFNDTIGHFLVDKNTTYYISGERTSGNYRYYIKKTINVDKNTEVKVIINREKINDDECTSLAHINANCVTTGHQAVQCEITSGGQQY